MDDHDIDAAANAVLAFWFEGLAPAQWWRVDAAVDAKVCARFGPLHASLAEDVPLIWLATPERALAAILVLDQFSRNIHRGDAKAFAQDDKARALAEAAIDKGHDRALPPERRHFLYMPFMHAESIVDQERSVALFATLGEDLLKHARDHKAVFDRFGRFPKRNAALGRENTPGEEDYLKDNAGGGA